MMKKISAAIQCGKLRSLNVRIKLQSSCIPPVSALPHGGQVESLWGKRWGLKLSMVPSIGFHAGWHCCRKKRKEQKLIAKKRQRLDLKMDLPGDRLDFGEETGVFSLSKIRSKQVHVNAICNHHYLAWGSLESCVNSDYHEIVRKCPSVSPRSAPNRYMSTPFVTTVCWHEVL